MIDNPRAPEVAYEKVPRGYVIYDDDYQDKDDIAISSSSSSNTKDITIKITTITEKGIKRTKILGPSDEVGPSIQDVLSHYDYTDNHIINLYNKTVHLLKEENKAMDGMHTLLPLMYYWIHMYNTQENGNKDSETSPYNIHLSCHVGFLLLDCILQSYRGSWNGLPSTLSFHDCIMKMDDIAIRDEILKKKVNGLKDPNALREEKQVEISGKINIDDILEFMEKIINEEASTSLHSSVNEITQENEDYINELKFRWHLYKSRIVLLQKNKDGKYIDKTKHIKKELKSALELYHHKLRTNEPTSTNPSKSLYGFVTNYRNPILQNQIALYIKATHENESNTINNNPKRSLKLCMEARRLANQMLNECAGTQKEEQELLEDAIYYNNLGIIHMNSSKINMAYIYYTKAVSHICALYNKDMTSNTISNNIPVCEILHNASIVALQAKQYYSAYYYMAKCIQLSPNVFAKRSRCWLRLAEAVIGYYNTDIKKKGTPSMNKYQLSYNDPNNKFIPRLVSYTTNLVQNYDYENEPYLVLSPVLGDEKDMQQLEEIPLLRALFSLRAALLACPKNDEDCFEIVHLHMAYCHLEMNGYISSLHSSNVILQRKYDKNCVIAKRRRVTARLYACESLCYLGKVRQALYLFHTSNTSSPSTDDFFKPNDYLYKHYANDLSMVSSLNDEDVNQQQKRRLKDAMSIIHIASSAIYAFYNDISYTEQYALSSLYPNTKAKTYNDQLLQQEINNQKEKMTVNNDYETKEGLVPEDIKIVALRNVLLCLFQKQQWDDATSLLHELLHMKDGVVEEEEKNEVDHGDQEEKEK